MDRKDIPAVVAPNMGSFADGIKAFQTSEPPYGRGGGTPATQFLAGRALEYLGKWTPDNKAFTPSISITPNGQAANHDLFRSLWGVDMVASKHVFGTTTTALNNTFARIGGQMGGSKLFWADPCRTQDFINQTTSKTKIWFVEAVSNPAGRVPDLENLSKAAKERDVMLVIDTTLGAGMPRFNALNYADAVTISLSKQAGGGDNKNMGGAIITRGDFQWDDPVNQLTELRAYFEDQTTGKIAVPENPLAALVKKIGVPEGTVCMAPEIALSIADSLPQVQSNVEKMCRNARMIADLLKNHPKVKNVRLTGHNTDSENDERFREYFGDNHFVMMIDLKDNFKDATRHFIDSGELLHAVVLGQKETGISNPATSTHRQYSEEKLRSLGIYKDTIRMSVGTEDEDELGARVLAALEHH